MPPPPESNSTPNEAYSSLTRNCGATGAPSLKGGGCPRRSSNPITVTARTTPVHVSAPNSAAANDTVPLQIHLPLIAVMPRMSCSSLVTGDLKSLVDNELIATCPVALLPCERNA